MKPAAKASAPPAQDAKIPAPRRVSEARTVAPKVGDAQQSRPQPDSLESPSPALFPVPEFAHPALSGPTKDGRSSDPSGAPAVEAELVQDAAPVSKRDSVVSAAGRPAGPQPASESRKPPERSQALSAPEIDHYGSEDVNPYGPTAKNAPQSTASSQPPDVGLNVPRSTNELAVVKYRPPRGSVEDAHWPSAHSVHRRDSHGSRREHPSEPGHHGPVPTHVSSERDSFERVPSRDSARPGRSGHGSAQQ